MTKSQLHVKQICLPSLILNVRNYEKNHHDADIMIRNFHISHNAPFLGGGGGQIRCIVGEVQAAYGILWQGIV